MTFGISGQVPGERLAWLTIADDSDTFTTTEVTLGSIKVPILEGSTYRLGFSGSFAGSVGGDRILVALTYVDPSDLDSTSNIIQQSNLYIPSSGVVVGWPIYLETEWDAEWTGEVQVNVTGDRIGGTGDINLVASPGRKATLFAEFVS